MGRRLLQMMRTLPLIDELEAALNSGTSSRRVEMLTRITDLFVGGAARYSDEIPLRRSCDAELMLPATTLNNLIN